MRGWLRRNLVWSLAAIVIAASLLGYGLHRRSREAMLVRLWPEQLAHDPALLSFAVSLARPVYAAHCATCHGADLGGDRRVGAPKLGDSVWLYGDGGIGDIENTILYGIRSGHPRAHNVTDMPAEGRSHQLSSAQVDDVVEFVLSLSRQPHDDAAAVRGRGLFYDQGNCFDCHARDALGSTDYGSPSLLGPGWIYGGDRQTLRETIYNGRHGICPAWIDELTPTQIRAVAAFLYVASQPAGRVAAR
jgi:cytochrome c oxidase cbb3-type subunit III